MKKFALSFNEIAVLAAFGMETEASIPELAVSAKLTPSEIRESVASLENKKLVELFGRGRFVRLTGQGHQARSNWEFSGHDRHDPRLYGLPTGSSLDSAIDAEVERLRGN